MGGLGTSAGKRISPVVIPDSQSLCKATGRGVRIGLLDTGVASMHPQLQSAKLTNYAVSATDPWQVRSLTEGKDYRDHGTACAGILHRHAPDAEIHSVCVISDSGEELLQRLIAGLRFAINQRWNIINFSLGTRIKSDELTELCKEATQAGQILIAAKDNASGESGFPAAFPSVLGVDLDHFESPLEFSYHPEQEIEVIANGIYIEAPRPGGGSHHYTGTSYACPHISALAAKISELSTDLSAQELRQVLSELSTAPTSRQPTHQL